MARGAERAEQVRQTRGSGRREEGEEGEEGGEGGEPQVRRARGTARGAHATAPRLPINLAPWFPEEERAGNIPRENGNYSIQLRDIIRWETPTCPG